MALLGIFGWSTFFTAALPPVMVLALDWRGAHRRGAIAALMTGPTVQIVAELARGPGIISPTWGPGLTGAVVGTLPLAPPSTPWRSLEATHARAP